MKNVIQIKGKCKKGGVDGEKCTVECNEGFNPDTPFEIICLGGKWLVNGKTPKCTLVDCGLPKIENAQISKYIGHKLSFHFRFCFSSFKKMYDELCSCGLCILCLHCL